MKGNSTIMKIVALLLCLIITKHYGISMRLVENNNNIACSGENMCSSNTMSSTTTTSSNAAAAAAAKIGTDATPKASQKTDLRNKIKPSTTNGKSSSSKPNILVILFDDLGYHDLGEFSKTKRHLCHTPVMNGLMKNGVKLKNFYVQPVCSPTRSSLLTGRYPLRYGGQTGACNPANLACMLGWAPIGEPMLAERMKEIGYSTYMSGKWHMGSAGYEQIPTGRGFDEHYGIYMGGGDHWTHVLNLGADNFGSLWPTHPNYKAMQGALDLHNDKLHGKKVIRNTVLDMNGTHSSDLFGMNAERMIMNHNTEKPMFLYLPFQAPHWPVQNPAGTEEMHEHIPGKQRRKWCGLISHMDGNVGRVVSALKAKNMYDNTFIFAFSDNGGDVRTGASNHPYRGDKMSVWEGGTRSPAFIHSPNPNIIPENIRGTDSEALGHAVDLFPTLLSIAGGSARPSSTGAIDGIDMLSTWKSGSNDSPRKEMVYNIDPIGMANTGGNFFTGGTVNPGQDTSKLSQLDQTRIATSGNIPESCAAIRVGKYKLVEGQAGRGDWHGTDPSATWTAKYIMGPDATNYELLESGGPFGDMKVGDGNQYEIWKNKIYTRSEFESTIKMLWLFDLEKDPAEHHDISAEHPEIVEQLQKRLQFYRDNAAVPLAVVPRTVWTIEKRKQMKARSRGFRRRLPGVPFPIIDLYYTDEEVAKNNRMKNQKSKL